MDNQTTKPKHPLKDPKISAISGLIVAIISWLFLPIVFGTTGVILTSFALANNIKAKNKGLMAMSIIGLLLSLASALIGWGSLIYRLGTALGYFK